jgi:hypothetical protein
MPVTFRVLLKSYSASKEWCASTGSTAASRIGQAIRTCGSVLICSGLDFGAWRFPILREHIRIFGEQLSIVWLLSKPRSFIGLHNRIKSKHSRISPPQPIWYEDGSITNDQSYVRIGNRRTANDVERRKLNSLLLSDPEIIRWWLIPCTRSPLHHGAIQIPNSTDEHAYIYIFQRNGSIIGNYNLGTEDISRIGGCFQ